MKLLALLLSLSLSSASVAWALAPVQTPCPGCDCATLPAQCTGAPATCGKWSDPYCWFEPLGQHGDEVVHLSLLANGPEAGNVLMWRNPHNPPQLCGDTQTWLWRPGTPGDVFTSPGLSPENMFCSTHAFGPDGGLVVFGAAQFMPGCTEWPDFAHSFNSLNPVNGWSNTILSSADALAACVNRYYAIAFRLPMQSGGLRLITAGGGRGDPDNPTPEGCQTSAPYSNNYEFFDPSSSPPWHHLRTALPPGPPAEPPGQQVPRSLLWYSQMVVLSKPDSQGRARVFVAHAGTYGSDFGDTSRKNEEAYVLVPEEQPPQNVTIVTPSSRARKYASCVLLPKLDPDAADEVLLLGGSNPGFCEAFCTAERIQIPDPGGQWPSAWTLMPMGPNTGPPNYTPTGPAFPRAFANAVLLPDGTVFVYGGVDKDYQRWLGTAVVPSPDCPPVGVDACVEFHPVLDAVIYDPLADTWSYAARNQSPRLYHACGLLLPDGRVLVAGGDRPINLECPYPITDAEIYSPPYLFKTRRPEILDPAPTSIPYAQSVTLQVRTKIGETVGPIVLVKTGSVTHHFDPEQRLVGLNYTVVTSFIDLQTNTKIWVLSVTGPRDRFLAPQGFYMLFALNNSGVPAVARFVQVP